ncbi:hypothetical protein Acid345_4104 [Candidatus Koribacter versatilis Ellin345]|uniref:DUF7674 domain-containing protein n=1 Tax=Koribacter versatilis (strain Ellin345) TaxID=204669 RepID=Q1IJ46_KORVE|nr:hypothetical protein [Candidatus Koribacter versatilis]ABF43104.1 hypothetical protein Acid345_4104 [Candidatus Koribacter versatilis Ellin345]
MISAADLNRGLVEALPELASDREAYEQRRLEDPEFLQSFIGYSFIPTLQVALDQNVDDFCRRAFALIERLLAEGDDDVQAILRDEFFDYGPACEKWMRHAGTLMGPLTRKAATGK